MTATSSPDRLFTERLQSYDRFIRFVRYPQGLRRFFVRSPLLTSGLRVLDAGCGTGVLTLALRDALVQRGLKPGPLHAFDVTAAMLERFRERLQGRGITDVETAQADVLHLATLPGTWTQYDLIVSAAMLEYVPRHRFADALRGLHDRLRSGGHLVLFVTRRNWLMRPLIGRWWRQPVRRWGAAGRVPPERVLGLRPTGLSVRGPPPLPMGARRRGNARRLTPGAARGYAPSHDPADHAPRRQLAGIRARPAPVRGPGGWRRRSPWARSGCRGAALALSLPHAR